MSSALADAEAAALLDSVASAQSLALAVSGGSDSLALLAVVDRWRKARGRPGVIVLTVDHGLSPGSDRVVADVAAIAAARGLAARILRWEGTKPAADLEAAARRARYALLFEAARGAGATHLLTAHSLEDQAETFLMRLERGSGIFGLAAMRATVAVDGLTLFRPFLAIPRARLAATTAAAGLSPHRDPMNADPRFQRVRMRRQLPALAAGGITAEAIAATAARLAAAADAIDAMVDALVAEAVTVDAFAVATLRADAFARAPAEVRFRLLVRLLQAIGGAEYPPRSARVEALVAALARPTRRTLAGVVIERRAATIRLWREAGRAGLPVLDAPPGSRLGWDHRFAIAVPPDAPPGLVVAPLVARPTDAVRPAGVPAAALAALPAVFAGKRLLAVPSLGWGTAAGIEVTESVSRRLARPARFPVLADSAQPPVHAAAISA
jgi:tRNA(Ile)-lysidine synthase